MKKIERYFAAAILVFVFLAFAAGASADTAYSTEKDPLVTQSYVNKIKNEIAEELASSMDDGSFADYVANAGYKAVRLEKGQSVNAAGTCEIILRAGTAYASVTDKGNIAAGVGFSDVTEGVEITNGLSVPKNHCLLASAGDGRNVVVTSDVAYFLVKGDYSVVG